MSKFDEVKSQTTRMGAGKLRTKFGGHWKRGGEAKKLVYIWFRKFKKFFFTASASRSRDFLGGGYLRHGLQLTRGHDT